MQVVKGLDCSKSTIVLSISVSFDAEEADLLKRYGFYSYRIKTRDGPFIGRNHISNNIKSAYRTQLGRIKNRWSTALVRTTGFVLIDTILAIVSNIIWIVKAIVSLVFGRRKTLKALIKGIQVRSKRIEDIREAEIFILFSLAAIWKALEYARRADEQTYLGLEFLAELDGLDFAGAGQAIESEFEAINTISDGWTKVHSE